MSKFGLPLFVLKPGNSDQLEANTNILSLTPSQHSMTEAAMTLVDKDSDVKMIYYYHSSDIHSYLDYLNNNGKYGQISFQQASNISLDATDYMKTKTIILSKCNRQSGVKFLEEAMLKGKTAQLFRFLSMYTAKI